MPGGIGDSPKSCLSCGEHMFTVEHNGEVLGCLTDNCYSKVFRPEYAKFASGMVAKCFFCRIRWTPTELIGKRPAPNATVFICNNCGRAHGITELRKSVGVKISEVKFGC